MELPTDEMIEETGNKVPHNRESSQLIVWLWQMKREIVELRVHRLNLIAANDGLRMRIIDIERRIDHQERIATARMNISSR